MTLGGSETPVAGRMRPAPGSKCQETSMVASPMLCGAPAEFVVKNRDPKSYNMCAMCADHNVKNRGAKYVLAPPSRDEGSARSDDIEFEDAPAPDDTSLTSIAALAQRQRDLETRISTQTAALQRTLASYVDLTERQLPEAMAAVGLRAFELADGGKMTIESRFIGSKLTNEEGLTYLEKNQLGDTIKTSIALELAQEDHHLARSVIDHLRAHPAANRFLNLRAERSVHPSTIASVAKNLTEAQRDPPLDILGVYKRVRAKLSGRKLRGVKIDSAFTIDDQS